MKKVVRLKNKETEKIDSYPSLADLVRRNGEENIGIGLQSLYNAICLNKGRWENDRFLIYIEEIDLGRKEWR